MTWEQNLVHSHTDIESMTACSFSIVSLRQYANSAAEHNVAPDLLKCSKKLNALGIATKNQHAQVTVIDLIENGLHAL